MLTTSPTTSTSQVQHSYGTRIRQNSILKPSARLRQSPDPPPSSLKKSKHPPTHAKTLPLDHTPRSDLPVFPPTHVMLHPEDSNSKVFLAIGRSFLSVNNCAMTIKDLAEMTLKFGLVCQNVSAAGQAITTYIRSHLQRCEAQQDHPLLLRHVLSGTPSDDDLLPALHSRTGGAHCPANSDGRVTNFRKGTTVWYLSKATGAPCPFARAGIQLCEYGENGRLSCQSDQKDRKKDRERQRRLEESCGQKRKRLPRGCLDPDSDSDIDTKPPPKVKLTLRLRPCLSATASTSTSRNPASPRPQAADSDSESDREDSMSVDDSSEDEGRAVKQTPPEQPWSLPPYPRRSITIPCYTPSIDGPYQLPFTSSSLQPYRRAPSVPYSIASPPPNSEDEDDDYYHISTAGHRLFPADRRRNRAADTDLDLDFGLDSDCERETQWESPGPRSPSAPVSNGLVSDIVVKQEPTEVKGVWDGFDIISDRALHLESATTKVKVEDPWDWHSLSQPGTSDGYPPIIGLEESPRVKQEEVDLDSQLALFDDLGSPLFGSEFESAALWPSLPLFSPSLSPDRRHSETWSDLDGRYSPALTSTSLPTHAPITSPHVRRNLHVSTPSTASTIRPDDQDPSSPSQTTSILASLVQSMTVTSLEPPGDTIAPSSLIKSPSERASHDGLNNVVVVHTCQPCIPAVSATQIEGISVYQMTLGTSLLLRRIDTDFVNLSPIINYLGLLPSSLSPITSAVVVNKGSTTVTGTWVPLASAQAFVRERPLPSGLLDIFLSDTLFERFPPALQDFHLSNTPGRLLNQFGPHFKSTADVHRPSPLSIRTDIPPLALSWPVTLALPRSTAQIEHRVNAGFEFWDVQNDNPMPIVRVLSEEPQQFMDTPLSATEQEMFSAFCLIPDWDKENSPPVVRSSTPPPQQQLAQEKAFVVDEQEIDVLSETSPTTTTANAVGTTMTLVGDRPLRRSKRVANAMAVAARTRTRSFRRSARNSLN